jgi:hypothetical protein
VVTDLREKYGFDVEVIKRTDMSLLEKLSMLRLPAVEVDGRVISQGRDIELEELEREITSRVS